MGSLRSVVAEESTFSYLLGLAQPDSYSIGLIIGQSAGRRDFVIHLTRTPSLAIKGVTEEGSPQNSDNEDEPTAPIIKKINDINDGWVADHAKHVTRMLPGGFWVLGIFIVGPDDVFSDDKNMIRIRNILSKVTKNLAVNRFLHGNNQSGEKLLLNLNSKTHKFVCKSLEIAKLSGAVNNVDWKFQPNPTKWHQLDCQFDFDQLFPITNDKVTLSIKSHLQEVLLNVSNTVEKAICMIDGELKDNSEPLDSLSKKKKGKSIGKEKQETKIMTVNLYIPCDAEVGDKELRIDPCCGEMTFLGILASRVFLHQKATVEEAVKAVKHDIVRSLASRLEMHWDSLIEEENGSPEERVTLHEPPRRVLVPLPHCKVTLSDYLFPGEGPSEALISLQELLDLKVTEEDVQKDLEFQADATEFYNTDNDNSLEVESSEDLLPVTSNAYSVLTACLAFTIFIAVASIAMQYIQNTT